MKPKHRLRSTMVSVGTALLFVGTVLLLDSCGPMDRNILPPPTPTPAAMAPPAAVAAADTVRDFARVLDANQNLPYDALLIDALSAHLLGTIDLANQAISRAQRDEVRLLAEEIVDQHQQQLPRLQQWRRTWYPDLALTPATSIAAVPTPLDVPMQSDFDAPFVAAMQAHTAAGLELIAAGQAQAKHSELQALLDQLHTIYTTQQELLAGVGG